MNALDKFNLNENVVIITGGAGLLGEQYALAITDVGGIPIVADINKDKAILVANQISSKTGKEVVGEYVDVTDKKSVASLVKKVVKNYGRINGLINNAALDPKFDKTNAKNHTNSFEDYPFTLWSKSIDVNLTGMFLCAQAVAPVMLSQGKGSIVNISSTYGLVGPDQRLYLKKNSKEKVKYKPVTYSVTKSAVIGLTRYLATYWAGKNIRINTLTPGGVFNNHDDEFAKKYSEKTTLSRMANKDEYNAAIVFLLSDASSYMTGSNLVIDGGWTAW